MNKREVLEKAGWSLWYNDNYWVHPKTITDPKSQDHTNYGMSLDDAYTFEVNNLAPHKSIMGIPYLGRLELASRWPKKEGLPKEMSAYYNLFCVLDLIVYKNGIESLRNILNKLPVSRFNFDLFECYKEAKKIGEVICQDQISKD